MYGHQHRHTLALTLHRYGLLPTTPLGTDQPNQVTANQGFRHQVGTKYLNGTCSCAVLCGGHPGFAPARAARHANGTSGVHGEAVFENVFTSRAHHDDCTVNRTIAQSYCKYFVIKDSPVAKEFLSVKRMKRIVARHASTSCGWFVSRRSTGRNSTAVVFWTAANSSTQSSGNRQCGRP